MFLLALSLAFNCWTNSQKVTGLAISPIGKIAASTFGGLVERDRDGKWSKLTVADGLPANEVVSVSAVGDGFAVTTPNGVVRRSSAGWAPYAGPPPAPTGPVKVAWSEGTVSFKALEGVFLNGRPFNIVFPKAALPITAITGDDRNLVVGTAGHGLWEFSGSGWKHVDFDEPSGNSIVGVAEHKGTVYVSTLESGLNAFKEGKWSVVQGLSTLSPREAVEFDGALWVRHASGQVDCLRDAVWKNDVLKGVLPRKEARFIATDGGRLFVAQWAGWSVLQGGVWKHELKRKELEGVATTCLLLVGDKLYVGTQGKGLAVADLSSDKVDWIDERSGMTDDWVTCLGKMGEDVFAGTFVGGLVRISRGAVKPFAETKGENVTSMVESGGLLYVSTRTTVYSFNGYNLLNTDKLVPSAAKEVQALASTKNGLWLGTRSGLYLVKP